MNLIYSAVDSSENAVRLDENEKYIHQGFVLSVNFCNSEQIMCDISAVSWKGERPYDLKNEIYHRLGKSKFNDVNVRVNQEDGAASVSYKCTNYNCPSLIGEGVCKSNPECISCLESFLDQEIKLNSAQISEVIKMDNCKNFMIEDKDKFDYNCRRIKEADMINQYNIEQESKQYKIEMALKNKTEREDKERKEQLIKESEEEQRKAKSFEWKVIGICVIVFIIMLIILSNTSTSNPAKNITSPYNTNNENSL